MESASGVFLSLHEQGLLRWHLKTFPLQARLGLS